MAVFNALVVQEVVWCVEGAAARPGVLQLPSFSFPSMSQLVGHTLAAAPPAPSSNRLLPTFNLSFPALSSFLPAFHPAFYSNPASSSSSPHLEGQHKAHSHHGQPSWTPSWLRSRASIAKLQEPSRNLARPNPTAAYVPTSSEARNVKRPPRAEEKPE